MIAEVTIPTSAQVSDKPANGVLTQRQIAEKLGVSRQLVGFALRGEGRMSDEMRRQILEVAQANGYDRFSNHEARVMAARRYGKRVRTGILAVLFPATFRGEPLSRVPYFAEFFDGLEAEAIKRGLDLMLCPSRATGLPRLIQQGQVDGVIGLMNDTDVLGLLKPLDLPTVYIAPTPLESGTSNVEGYLELCGDFRHGGALATEHLIGQGHRRIAYIGVPYLPYSGQGTRCQIVDGYREVLASHQIPWDESLNNNTMTSVTIEAGTTAIKNWLQQGPIPFTALICHNDLMAMGAVLALQAAGYRVPEDISVVGFDDVSTQYMFQPALTSVSPSRKQMGQRAVQLLVEDELPADGYRELFPMTLFERHSTAQVIV